MKRFTREFTISLILMLLLFALPACSRDSREAEPEQTAASEEAIQEDSSKAELQDDSGLEEADSPAEQADVPGEQVGNEEEITMKMTINDTPVQVAWENNASVKALNDLAGNDSVTIEMSAYGGFEQVGSIGTTLPSNDTSIKTKAGDIVLYTSDHMVIFYGSNSWAYTRLGRITDKSNSELQELLGGSGVTVIISAD